MFVSQTKGWQNGIAWLLFEDDGKCEDNETEEGFAEGAGVAVVRVAIVGVDLASTLSHKLQCKQSTLHSIHHRLLLLGGHGVAGTAQLVIPVRPLGHFEEFLHAGGVEYGGAGGGLGAADRAAVLHQHRNLLTNHIGKGLAFNILNPTCVLRVLVTAAGPVVEVPVCQHCTAAEPVTSVVSNTSTGVGRLVGSTATHLSTHCRPGVKSQ